MKNSYTYTGPLNGAYAIQDKFLSNELIDFVKTTNDWDNFFVANGITNHSKQFLQSFRNWIAGSNLNTIKGLENFSYATQTNGTSESFQMFMMRHHNRSFKFFKGDFMMHKVASNVMRNNWSWINNAKEIQKGDAVIISCPFSDTGSKHKQMEQLLLRCVVLNVPVLVDMAYFGMCYDIDVNLDYSCIEEVTFSLGKTFPLIGMRAGIRFQRESIDDPVLFANQHGIVNNFAAMIGHFAMNCAGADYVPKKYKSSYLTVCKNLNLIPTNCVLFALSPHEEHKEFNRGNELTRLCVSKLVEEEYEYST